MAKFKLSVDDGCASDVRVAELVKKYGIETVFYWPVEWHSLAYEKGYKPLTYRQAEVIAEDFEIGAHTVTHRHLTRIPHEEAMHEILESKTILQDMFNIHVTKFCPPRGYTNNKLTEFTLKHFESQRLTKGEGLVHIHPDSGANGNIHWEIKAKALLEQGKLKELWGHSWEFDKYEMWEQLERFFVMVGFKGTMPNINPDIRGIYS